MKRNTKENIICLAIAIIGAVILIKCGMSSAVKEREQLRQHMIENHNMPKEWK